MFSNINKLEIKFLSIAFDTVKVKIKQRAY